jgi:hypothetical protein
MSFNAFAFEVGIARKDFSVTQAYTEGDRVIISTCKKASTLKAGVPCESTQKRVFESREEFMQRAVYELVVMTGAIKNESLIKLVKNLKKLSNTDEIQAEQKLTMEQLKYFKNQRDNLSEFYKQGNFENVESTDEYIATSNLINNLESDLSRLKGILNKNEEAELALTDLKDFLGKLYDKINSNELGFMDQNSPEDDILRLVSTSPAVPLNGETFLKSEDVTVDPFKTYVDYLTQYCSVEKIDNDIVFRKNGTQVLKLKSPFLFVYDINSQIKYGKLIKSDIQKNHFLFGGSPCHDPVDAVRISGIFPLSFFEKDSGVENDEAVNSSGLERNPIDVIKSPNGEIRNQKVSRQ